MNKLYIERYGIEAVKKHLGSRYTGRYFKTTIDYANGGGVLFNANLFKQDIGMPNFPIVKRDYNGWNLPKAPTPEQFEAIYNYLTA